MERINNNLMDSISSFLGGACLASLGAVRIWFMPLQVHTGSLAGDIAMEYAIKVIGTVMLGTIGGLTGLATKDLYTYLKRKFKKK